MSLEERVSALEKEVDELKKAARPTAIIRMVPEGKPVTGVDLGQGLELIDLISVGGIPE